MYSSAPSLTDVLPLFCYDCFMEKSTPRLLAKSKGLVRYIGIPCIRGHNGERYTRNNGCVACHFQAKRDKAKYARVGRPKNNELFIGPPKPKRVVFNPKTETDHWIVRSKNSKKAKQRHGLSVEYYKTLIVTHCPLLGIELTYKNCKSTYGPYNYATLDKIDPTKGYVPGNVQIVSFRANTLKNSATIEEMRLILSNWEKQISPLFT